MKKISPKTLERLNKLTLQRDALCVQETKEVDSAKHLYGIGDEHFDYDYAKFTDKDHDFDVTHAEIHAKYDRERQIVQAKWAALFLIATNIARRGKPLHPDTAKKKLQKYGSDGDMVSAVIDMHICPMALNSEPFLASELYYQYGVVLMDEYMANMVKQKINYYSKNPWQQAKAQHYRNFLKKFHKSVLTSKFDQREYEPF